MFQVQATFLPTPAVENKSFDGVRLPSLFLRLSLLYWKSPTQTGTIVVNFIRQKALNRQLFLALVISKKRTFDTDIKKGNEK